ncbi:CRTAC1 family protein [Marinicella litoralis]|uniref:VCBS repeat protein n=1 Tax=Marinicella litoralis TaxID=644220 RepID=A0A4R6XSA5_9GAMM|nr:CRTAC1 family protein [Marinicella litoralis]TDR22815.1 VCBS repeat protein [Marinicella litoralis]
MFNKNKKLLLLALVVQQSAAVTFENVTVALGIDMPHFANKMSTGIAAADFDNNGYVDLYLTGYDYDSKLYFNDGQSFIENSQLIVPDLSGERCGSVAAADFDNDGWQDIYVACWGNNYLLHNQQGNGFVDITTSSGTDHLERTEAVSWGDLNNDGLLDLVLGVTPLSGTPDLNDPNDLDHVFFNNGDLTFTDIYGVLDPVEISRSTLALVLTDIDMDNDLDIYFANDKHQVNVMLRNDGPGCGGWCFTNVAGAQGSDHSAYCMGVAVGDYDNDLDWDLSYSSIDEHILLQNTHTNTEPIFSSVAQSAGVNISTGYGWSTLLFDTDNDGWEDMYLATTGGAPQPVSNHLFHNNQNGTFSDITATSGVEDIHPTEGAAWLDYDQDGRLDLTVGRFNLNYQFLKNSTVNNQHWIGFKLRGGADVNRDAIGSKIIVTDALGNSQMRELRAGESRGSNNEKILHFGLGNASSVSAQIIWPNGYQQSIDQVAADQYIQLVYPVYDHIFTHQFE